MDTKQLAIQVDKLIGIMSDIRDLLKAKPVFVAPRQINERFIDNGDGTITDKELKVIWVKDPTALRGRRPLCAACPFQPETI